MNLDGSSESKEQRDGHDDLSVHSESSDDEQDAQPAGPQSKPFEDRKRQNAIFDAWASDAMRDIGDQALKSSIKTEEHEQMSLKSIMARHETAKRIIASPRDYQMELFERAKTQNTIAVLDTGSGKTLIAVLLLRHILDQELERRESGLDPKTAFFVVEKTMLCQQQFAVLSANIDHKVAQFHGALPNSHWIKGSWEKNFAENMVIVCTPEILLSCLVHSFIRMKDLNLIVFDEAHHAKKGHPYARIVRDFYLAESDLANRPRIFGTTASPIDVCVRDLDIARTQAKELEEQLDAKIATPSDPESLRAFVHRPQELVTIFDSPGPPAETRLFKYLKGKFSNMRDFKKVFLEALVHTTELGSWGGDKYWSFACSEQKTRRVAALTERRQVLGRTKGREQKNTGDQVPPPGAEATNENELAALDEANDYIKTYDFGLPNHTNVTPKILELYGILGRVFERTGEARVLVFVERRSTAMLLYLLFSEVQTTLKHLRCGFLTGNSAPREEGIFSTSKSQGVLLLRFQKGDVNCIFATSAAEEGLDIQDCNVVVRFDPVKTMIQYIQSRGRARHANSKLYHMIERNNLTMHRLVSEVTQSAEIMSEFATVVPADRIIRPSDDDSGDELEQTPGSPSRGLRYPVFPSLTEATGAKLTFDFAPVVLAHFSACIPHEPEDDMSVSYILGYHSKGFISEVILPPSSPITSAMGEPHRSKTLAKRSAALEACKLLRQGNFLDENLLPTYARQLPSMRNARLAVKNRAATSYHSMSKPSRWSQGRGRPSTEYYLTIIDLAQPWQRPTRPLGLWTRVPLPHFPEFPVYKIDGKVCGVFTTGIAAPVDLGDRISSLTGFTLRILKDIFNKTFERNDEDMSYWLAPLVPLQDLAGYAAMDAAELVDWSLAEEVDNDELPRWHKGMDKEELEGKFLVDPYHGGRRFYTSKVDAKLRPDDNLPRDCAPVPGRGNTILDFSVSMWRKSAQRRTWDKTQPVVVAELNSHRLNVLASPGEQEKEAKIRAYLCPEPLLISRLPVEIAAMATIFPGIISRLESYMIAADFSRLVNLDIPPGLMLEAITKDSDNSDEDALAKINFQYGMGPNYERLEFIGDTFLKMATTISIFAHHAARDEFHMHVDRMQMICNANLMTHAKERGYYAYIRGQSFSRRSWYPELKLLAGKAVGRPEDRINLGDKTIADICEATIGAALTAFASYRHCDSSSFDHAVRAVTHFVSDANHDMLRWDDYLVAYNARRPDYIDEAATASQRHLAKMLAGEHSYHFRSARLARSAFSHSSYPRSWEPGIPSYERLEFLGDALLDMACILFLTTRHSEKRDPQWLTEHKMAMASNRFLGALCVRLGFYKHLRIAQAPLESAIRKYVAELSDIEQEHQGERDYWTLAREPPKCLPDIVEAYVGAIFVDSGFDFGEVQRFFDTHIKWYFEDMKIYDTFASHHPVTRVIHFLEDAMGCRNFRLMAQEMPTADGMASKALAGLLVHDQVVARGHAASVRYAKTAAANSFLKQETGIAPHDFRQKFRCDCSEGRGVIPGELAMQDPDD